ncbi:hypothetical protein, partial [Hyphomicrobium sp. 99]|uniref:hypothetical protein n=1 Tax=Hyphomicrobium sp. 99 TaxID=1163419 RepID=UPI0005F7C5C7
MRRQGFEVIEVSSNPYRLPITLRQTNTKLMRLPGLVLMGILAALIVAPQLAFAAYAIASPDVRHAMIAHPTVAVELALALVFWVGLIVWPMRNILLALLSDRIVDIRDGEVKVVDRTAFSKTLWRAPLATYEGVAVNIRSSLSGVRQEAVLVHPDRNRSIILMTAEHIGAREVEELSHLLSLPCAPAERHFNFGGRGSRRENPVAA